MKKTKQTRLEKAGWTVGTAQEFLNLSDEESAMLEVRLRLSQAFKARRIRQNLTQRQVGQKIGSSQSRVAKIEAGDPSVSLDLLVRSLFKLGATRHDLARHLLGPKGRKAA